jgi:hypothetical protein
VALEKTGSTNFDAKSLVNYSKKKAGASRTHRFREKTGQNGSNGQTAADRVANGFGFRPA